MKTWLFVDADILAFKACAVNQSTYQFDEGDPAVVSDWDMTIKNLNEFLEHYIEDTEADEVIMCLSDDYENFRKKVLPTYKSNRKGSVRPELLYEVKEYLFDNFRSYRKDTLEADDVMGILSTHPKLIKGKKIICSEDKDMKTIPGYLYNPNKAEEGVIEIDEAEANRFWMYQTLVGDTVDGYKGCPKIGDVKATAILQDIDRLENMWDAVLTAYHDKGLTEKDALVQARCARILRYTDYNFKEKEVVLWTP